MKPSTIGDGAGADAPTVVITGAGHGIGARIAGAAAEAGWQVGVLDRDGDAAAAVAAGLRGAGIPLVADIVDERSVDVAFDRFAGATGRAAPDGLVACAGIVRFGSLLDIEVADWRAVVDVNLTGTFLVARAAARRMAAAGRPGSLVTITSMNGVAPGPHAGAYGATKAGVALLTRQMALEWGPLGIRANAVAPGLIDAGMSEPIYTDAEVRERRAGAVPLGRLGTGDDVASMVLFLLSDGAGYVSGTEVLVDGAVTSSIIGTLPRPHAVDGAGGPFAPGRGGAR